MTLVLFSVQAPRELDICVRCDSVFDVFTNSTVFMLGEQSPRDFLWKSFFFVWIADRHIQNGFLEPFILLLGIRFNEQRHPSLEADRGEARNGTMIEVYVRTRCSQGLCSKCVNMRHHGA